MSERSAVVRRGARTVVVGLLGVAVTLAAACSSKGDGDPSTSKGASASSSPSPTGPERQPSVDPRTDSLFHATTVAVGRSVVCMLSSERSGARPEGAQSYDNLDVVDGPDGVLGTPDDLPVTVMARRNQPTELVLGAFAFDKVGPQSRVGVFFDTPEPLEPMRPERASAALDSPATRATIGVYIDPATGAFTQIARQGSGLTVSTNGMSASPAAPADVALWSREILAYTDLLAKASGTVGCAPEEPVLSSPVPPPSAPSSLPPELRV